MKIYVVTAGSYSDYHIEKVFTDKFKAEEYRQWLYDANDIEEYETEDNLVVEKFYKILVHWTVYDDDTYELVNEVACPTGFDDVEFFYDWWEGEKYIRVFGIKAVDQFCIRGGLYEE